MDSIDAALQELKLQDKPNISATAKAYNIDRSTLSRRFNGVAQSKTIQAENSRFLTPKQERDLVQYISTLTERGTCPTPAMVATFARDIAGKEPGRSWSHRFCKRHQDILSSGYLSNIDQNRKNADTERWYRFYFDLISKKIQQYGILPGNMYNIDEKGFLIGIMKKAFRIFNKQAVKSGRVLGNNQDSNREWVTILATICADGTWIPPAIIYAGKTGLLQDSWVQDFEPGQHQAYFAASPNG